MNGQQGSGHLHDEALNNEELIEKGEKPLDATQTPEQVQANYEQRLKAMRKKSLEFREKAKALGALTNDSDTHDPIPDLKPEFFMPFYKPMDQDDTFDPQVLSSFAARSHRLDILDAKLSDPSTISDDRREILKEKEALLVVQAYMDTLLMRELIAGRVHKVLQEIKQNKTALESGSVKMAKELRTNKETVLKTIGHIIGLSSTSRIYFTTSVKEGLVEFENKHGEVATKLLEHLNERLGIQIGQNLEEFEVIESNEPEHYTLSGIIDSFHLDDLDSDFNSQKEWIMMLSDEILEQPKESPSEIGTAETSAASSASEYDTQGG